MQRVLSFPPQERHTPGEVISKRLCCSFLLTVSFLSLILGYLIGRYGPTRQLALKAGAYKAELANKARTHNDAASYLENKILADNILRFHRELVSQESVDENGSVNFLQAKKLQQHFESQRFDLTTPPLATNVLLSYYNPDFKSQAVLFDERKNIRFIAQAVPMKVQLNSTNGIPASTTVQGDLIYCNFGQEEDLRHLHKLKISVLRSILLIRIKHTATIYEVVSRALDAGTSGVILFSDPLHFPDDDVQFLNPALVGRLQGQVTGIPTQNTQRDSVAVIQIKAREAEILLNEMSPNNASPETWRGRLHSSYPLGPGLKQSDWSFHLEVHIACVFHTYYNVISAIRGGEEPDRYVLLGTNREMLLEKDVDHLGSTAAMMEIARVLGQLRKNRGWVPRRSLVFCNWGLQGDGHFNSEIWAQQYTELLRDRAVAYISMEIAVIGNESLSVETVPLLERAVQEASSLIPNPNRIEASHGYKTILDSWKRYYSVHHNTTPQVENVKGEGDYQMFLHEQGVPSLDFSYTGTKKYEDKNFTIHRAVTEIWALLMWTLADSPILPFRVTDYAAFLSKSLTAIVTKHNFTIIYYNVSLEILENSLEEFSRTAEYFEEQIKIVDRTNQLRMRILNDKLVHLEKTLLCSSNSGRHEVLWEGATHRTGLGHLHLTLVELAFLKVTTPVKDHIQLLSRCIHSASLLLKDSVLAFNTSSSYSSIAS